MRNEKLRCTEKAINLLNKALIQLEKVEDLTWATKEVQQLIHDLQYEIEASLRD